MLDNTADQSGVFDSGNEKYRRQINYVQFAYIEGIRGRGACLICRAIFHR